MLNRIKLWVFGAAVVGAAMFSGACGLWENVYFRTIRGIINEDLFG